MSDQGAANRDPAKQSLSDIGHLFLSSVRQQQTGGAAPPRRKGPPAVEAAPLHCRASIDLTEEELAQVMGRAGADEAGPRATVEEPAPTAPVWAVIGAHLNDQHSPGVREYARHLAAGGKRIGLMEVEGSEFRLAVFDRSPADSGAQGGAGGEVSDASTITAAIDELSWDVDQWLVALPASRTHEARLLLKNIDHWVLLSTAHPEDVVACYRTMKALADLDPARLTLALLDAGDAAEAEHAYRKLAAVASQFLHWNIERSPGVGPAADAAEHRVLRYRAGQDRTHAAPAAHWQVLVDFLVKVKLHASSSPCTQPENAPLSPSPGIPREGRGEGLPRSHAAPPPQPSPAVAGEGENRVIEVADTREESIINAVLSRAAGSLVECPLSPPACPSARLTVTRQRGLLLLAVARPGLADLRAIALAYRWLLDNLALIAMALPQISIDTAQRPALRLLVDHADAGAEVLAPLLENSSVTLQTYRKLKWGSKTGLLLEAA